jgi:dihydroflavonol-4-reductase
MAQRVLVTGISGYVGQHIAAALLRHGVDVVGTVRSLGKADGTAAALLAAGCSQPANFVEADLLDDRGWDAAMEGCDAVLHVASPFVLAEPRDENDLIAPAVEGTQRVLSAAIRAGVGRVVLTSSVVAMTSGKASGTYGPDAWSDVHAPIGAYAKSKTLAERAAWDLVADADTELVVINPGFIIGPSLGAPGDGQSVAMIRQVIGGKMPMIPDIAMGMVDVRDVAELHVAACSAPDAAGKRFIASSAEPVSMAHLASVLREAGYSKVPSRKAPNVAIKLMSLFDREAKGMVPQLGKRIAYDVSATYDVLHWQPTDLDRTLVEMAATLTT